MPTTLRVNAQANLWTVRTQKPLATKNKSKITPQLEVTTFYFRQKQKKKAKNIPLLQFVKFSLFSIETVHKSERNIQITLCKIVLA